MLSISMVKMFIPEIKEYIKEGNKIVFFNGESSDIGQFINVKIERTEAFALYGQKN